jgi:hypothetical protein
MAMIENVISSGSESAAPVTAKRAYGYRELPSTEAEQLDLIEQMRANLSNLEDLHGRLRFAINEIRTIVVR